MPHVQSPLSLALYAMRIILIIITFSVLAGCAFLVTERSFNSHVNISKHSSDSYKVILKGERLAHPTSELHMFIPPKVPTELSFLSPRKNGLVKFEEIRFLKGGGYVTKGKLVFSDTNLSISLYSCSSINNCIPAPYNGDYELIF